MLFRPERFYIFMEPKMFSSHKLAVNIKMIYNHPVIYTILENVLTLNAYNNKLLYYAQLFLSCKIALGRNNFIKLYPFKSNKNEFISCENVRSLRLFSTELYTTKTKSKIKIPLLP